MLVRALFSKYVANKCILTAKLANLSRQWRSGRATEVGLGLEHCRGGLLRPGGARAGERPRPRVTSAAFFKGLPAFGTLPKKKKSKKKSWPGTDFLDAARSVQKSASPDLDPRACDVFRFASQEANE